MLCKNCDCILFDKDLYIKKINSRTVLCYVNLFQNMIKKKRLVNFKDQKNGGMIFVMESDLISKKELLELTKISYGQLYRWKRKNLIPEDWFIRKSTFTGQETFFPKERILDRIDKIKNMKGEISLDELANMLSPNLMEISMPKNQLIQQNIVSKYTIDFYTGEKGETEGYAFEKILYLHVLDNMFQSGNINFE